MKFASKTVIAYRPSPTPPTFHTWAESRADMRCALSVYVHQFHRSTGMRESEVGLRDAGGVHAGVWQHEQPYRRSWSNAKEGRPRERINEHPGRAA